MSGRMSRNVARLDELAARYPAVPRSLVALAFEMYPEEAQLERAMASMSARYQNVDPACPSLDFTQPVRGEARA